MKRGLRRNNDVFKLRSFICLVWMSIGQGGKIFQVDDTKYMTIVLYRRQKQTVHKYSLWQPPDIEVVLQLSLETVKQEACGLVFSDMYLSLPCGPFFSSRGRTPFYSYTPHTHAHTQKRPIRLITTPPPPAIHHPTGNHQKGNMQKMERYVSQSESDIYITPTNLVTEWNRKKIKSFTQPLEAVWDREKKAQPML